MVDSGAQRRSLRFYSDRLDHLGPLHPFRGDEVGELVGSHHVRLKARIGKSPARVRLFEHDGERGA